LIEIEERGGKRLKKWSKARFEYRLAQAKNTELEKGMKNFPPFYCRALSFSTLYGRAMSSMSLALRTPCKNFFSIHSYIQEFQDRWSKNT
jgi:hypothetical protein